MTMSNQILTIRAMVDFAAERYGEKDFCRFFRDGEMVTKSFNEFREDCCAVSRYVKTIEKDKMHIAFIGNTNYEYVLFFTLQFRNARPFFRILPP